MECKEFHSVCRCGGHTKDHDVVFQYWPDQEYGDSFTISTGLGHYLPIWKRWWVGFKYFLGIDNTYVFYVEQDLDADGIKKLQAYINDVASTYSEGPVKKNMTEWPTDAAMPTTPAIWSSTTTYK